jgi:hypothetical protein
MGPVATNLWNDWIADEPTDMRRQASIWHYAHEEIYNAAGIAVPVDYTEFWSIGEWGGMDETGLWNKKIVATTAKGGNGRNGLFSSFLGHPLYLNIPNIAEDYGHATDLIFIRYADILLMHSELTKTVDGINEVRTRAGLPTIGAYSEDALRRERRYELAFEGNRWADIRRWHIAEDALEKQYGIDIFCEGGWTTMIPHGPGIRARYQATRGFFMIPQSQIDIAAGALKQNPGWGPEAIFSEREY